MHTVLLALVAAFANAVLPAAASCWEKAGERYRVDPHLLAAIAKVESNFKPDAVNASHERRTGSVDLGLMQINSSWLPTLARHGVTRERLFDACTSIHVAAWILADLFSRYGVTWEAVGAYNAACLRIEPSECAKRRHAYARKVHAALSEISRPAASRPVGDARLRPAPSPLILVVRLDPAVSPDSRPQSSGATVPQHGNVDG
jgi:hypothetical protein